MQCSLEGCERWGEGGRGILYFEASVVQWKDKRPWRPEYGPEGKHFVSGNSFIFILGGSAKLRWAGGGAAPRWAWQRPQKDGCAQCTGAHARLKPTSLSYIHLGSSVCHPVCHPVILSSCHPVCRCCGTLSYSFCFSHQTDQGDETEGFEREGLEIKR